MRRRALILSLTNVLHEPRVQRQAATLSTLGWDVVLAGLRDRPDNGSQWPVIPLDASRCYSSRATPLQGWSSHIPTMALAHFWCQPANRYIWSRIGSERCDLVAAHDYFTAPLAQRLARRNGAPFVVDSHEYAVGQFHFANDPARQARWERIEQPYVDAIQRLVYPRAAAITTVCEGIADLLQKDYGLAQPPTVVRSVPQYQRMPFRPTGARINLLYHGLAVPTRGLENAIRSVAHWREEFHFNIRAVGSSAYLDHLSQLARQLGVGHRVHILPAVPFGEMIQAANQADIGYVVLDNFGPQRAFTLPNKFFEYTMAGLATIASNLVELARLTRQYDLGRLVDGTDPRVIADCVNGLDRPSIDTFKRNALAAAEELCWDKEQDHLIRAYGLSPPATI